MTNTGSKDRRRRGGTPLHVLGCGASIFAGLRHSSTLLLFLLGGVWTASPATAQDVTYATETKAERGLLRGAMVGGALGGLSLGVLSAGLCDAADCDGSFMEGFLIGVLVGGVGGGVTGLVVGSALPEDGPARGGWSWTVRGGLGGPRHREVSGLGWVGDVSGLRAITDRTRFGVSLEYLGSSRRRSAYSIRDRDGQPATRTQVRTLHVTGARLVAARLLGETEGSGGYLMARVGVHPTWERTTVSGLAGEPDSTYRSFVPAPGGGVGVGVLVPVGTSWSLDIGGRGDIVLGIGSEGIVPVAQLAVGLRRTR